MKYPINRFFVTASIIVSAVWAFSGAVSASDTDTQKELDKKMEAAQAQLQEAAEKIAQLSREMSKGDAFAIMQRISPQGRKAMMGIKIDTPQDGRVGVLVRTVVEGGPAQIAGLEDGDLITSINRQDLTVGTAKQAIDLMMEEFKALEPGDQIEVVVERGSRIRAFDVTVESAEKSLPRFEKHYGSEYAFAGDKLGEMLSNLELGNLPFEINLDIDEEDLQELHRLPELLEDQLEGETGTSIIALLGRHGGFMPDFKLAAVDAELGTYFGVDKGVLIISKPSVESLGLKVGDVIVAINDQPVDQIGEVNKAFVQGAAGDTLSLDIVRQRQALTVDMQIPESLGKDWVCKSTQNGEGKSCVKRNGNAFSFSFSDDAQDEEDDDK